MIHVRHRLRKIGLLAVVGFSGCAYPMGGGQYPQTARTFAAPTASFAPTNAQTFNGPVALTPLPQTAMTTAPTLNSTGLAAANGNSAGSGAITYFNVRPGDSISSVAALYGVSEAEIRNINNLKPADKISPGQLVRIPDGATAIR